MSDDIFKHTVKIVVIDDNVEFGAGIKLLLAKEGVEVHTATDGPSGLELVKQILPDIVLLDVVMPGMDGIEVCKKIRQIPELSGVYIAMLSGVKTESDQMSKGLEAGADDYITRPIPNRELLARLRVSIHLKRTEKALEGREDRLTKIMLAANDGMWDWDLKTNKVYFDPRYYQMSGYDVDEFPHDLEEFQKRIHPGDVDYVMNEAENHLKGEIDRFDVKFRFRKKSGGWQWIQGKGVIVERDEKGTPQRFVGTHRDISELKQVEEALKESEAYLKAVLESTADGILAIGKDISVLYANDRFEKIWQIPEDVLENKDDSVLLQYILDQLIEPDDFFKKVEELYNSDEESFDTIEFKDGRVIELLSLPLLKGTEVMGRVWSFRDITERKQAEEKLKSNYELLQIAGETDKFGGWSVDLEKNSCTWSDVVADIHEMPHGYAPPVQEGINFYAPEWRDKITQVFTDCAEKGIPYDEEMEIITKKGKRVWVRTNGRAVKDENGEIIRVVGSFQDISEQKNAEEDLRVSEKSLREAQRLAQIGSWHYNPKTGQVKLSDEMYNITGMERNKKAMQIETHEKLYTPESWQIFLGAVEKARNTGKPYEIELEIVSKKGANRLVVARGEAINNEKGEVTELRGTLQDITERKQAQEALHRIEWMLSKKAAAVKSDQVPLYGDLSELNTNRLILDSVGKNVLEDIANDSLRLLESSSAIYEKNGDYALGIFSSGWCRLMDQASRELCGTDDNNEALECGKWLCHDSCWKEASQPAMESGRPVDIECNGGIHIYALPIVAGDEVLGAINFGYGDPPQDKEKLSKLAEKYRVPLDELIAKANEYQSRPSYIIETAKDRLQASANLISEIVSRKIAEKEILTLNEQLEEKIAEKTKELKERISELERFHDATVQREFRIKELRDEIERLKGGKDEKSELIA